MKRVFDKLPIDGTKKVLPPSLDDFSHIIESIRQGREILPLYRVFLLDLATARTDEAVALSGNILMIVSSTDAASTVSVRVNEGRNDLIPLVKGDRYKTPFYRFFLTNAAQPGKTVQLAVGVDSDFWDLIQFPAAGGGAGFASGDPVNILTVAGGFFQDFTRQLGQVQINGTPQVDVTDEAGRLLGIVNSITNPVDVIDRVGRLIGVVNSITNPVDVSDRVGRLLGVVNSITNAVDVSDRVGRLVGATRYLTIAEGFVNQLARLLGAVDIANVASGFSQDLTRQLGQADVSDRAARLLGLIMEMRAATLGVTALSAVNTALTLTLPAAGAGLFHYIVSLELVKRYSVVGVAAGAGVVVTSTNMPGNPAWSTEQLASPAGTHTKVIKEEPTTPLKSSVANTATTFVAPAQLQTIWRWNVRYFTAT